SIRRALTFFLMQVVSDCILRYAEHSTVKNAISCEVKCIYLDVRILTGMDESNIAVRDLRLNFKTGAGRDDHCQLLSGRHDTTDRVDCQLLHDAIYRGREDLLFSPRFGFR